MDQIFALEPRDPAWAGPTVGALRALVEADVTAIDPAGKVNEVDCRRTLCRLRWRGNREVAGAIFTLLGARGGDQGTAAFLPLRGWKAPMGIEGVEALRARRAAILDSLRAGRMSNQAKLPLDQLK
jgi:hypothetical protein